MMEDCRQATADACFCYWRFPPVAGTAPDSTFGNFWTGNSRRRAAAALGISRSTFCDRVRRLGLAPGAALASQ
jgi:hypothetical protein